MQFGFWKLSIFPHSFYQWCPVRNWSYTPTCHPVKQTKRGCGKWSWWHPLLPVFISRAPLEADFPHLLCQQVVRVTPPHTFPEWIPSGRDSKAVCVTATDCEGVSGAVMGPEIPLHLSTMSQCILLHQFYQDQCEADSEH